MLRKEFYKILISSVFTFIILLSLISNSFHKGIWETLEDAFPNAEAYFYLLVFFLIGYLLFNAIYFIAFLIKKVFKSNYNILFITSVFVTVCILVYTVNGYMIISKVNSYIYSTTYFSANKEMVLNDSKYQKYEWTRKEADDENIIDQRLIFEDDTTAMLIATKIKADRLLLLRYIFTKEKSDTNFYILVGNKYLLPKYLVKPRVPDYVINFKNKRIYLDENTKQDTI